MSEKKIEKMLTATFAVDYEVRITKIGEAFGFVAADVCKILDLTNPTMVLKTLDEDEKKIINLKEYIKYYLGYSEGRGNPNVTIVYESGLYHLILQSRKLTAKKIRKWVTSEVLPSIHKCGYYGAKPQEKLLAGLKPKNNFEDVGVVTNILDEKGIKYDYDITGITFEYNEKLCRVCQTYNIKLKLED